jgi:hypothetical protein
MNSFEVDGNLVNERLRNVTPTNDHKRKRQLSKISKDVEHPNLNVNGNPNAVNLLQDQSTVRHPYSFSLKYADTLQ